MRLIWISLGLLVALSAASVFTAQNAVSGSRAEQADDSISANELKPAECASVSVSNTVSGSGTVNGTLFGDLVVAGSGDDTIDGGGSGDCILGGAGADTIKGSGGSDVCIGGPGADTFDPDCETTYQ